ncbi:phospho-sugar mutase [Peptoanaerobacter stomatis]|uniref:Phosphoglucomutase n=1 Tax=Peptoanaerobacter stomatis TaxID=796937 RepID=J6HIX8_9FIRM|nr:phospho-sugar mutase [Peptoanaerobacter stomatis]EJU22583.1 putative phosphoglucomutase [Peptoanaerobacter stomatis]NWO25473.1 phospho-sugar mutase [Peptostreptococcaceae bacterium oral taxon 081]
MDYMKEYERWLGNEKLDEESRKELESIKDNKEEIQDRFYQELSFGTAGLRGKLGAGTNRMNSYVVARATNALAKVISSYGEDFKKKGIAIAYDCRICSDEFSKMSALIMASYGIKAYLFDSLRPTPELSFAVRYYGCASGINITASHNPKEYNGYKVYWQEGSQIKDDIADKVLAEINKMDIFDLPSVISEKEALDKGLLVYINKEVDEAYYEKVLSLSMRDDSEVNKDVKIVYTPLNGAGNIAVRTVLDRKGFKNVYVVKEQENPDGTFPTIKYPNPEDTKAFEYSEKLAKEKNADILIATDPDSDRLAVEVVHKGEIISLNGNQTGVLLINYILNSLKDKNLIPKNPAIIKSIVTGDMGTAIAKSFGVEMISVLTGFKNICALPNDWDKTGEKTYVFGYEESIGYNPGVFVRDKDAVSSALLLAEMAGYYKKQGKTLIDVLNELFEQYGYYSENTISVVLEGLEGQQRISRMMKEIRNIYPKQIGNASVAEITDYEKQEKTDLMSNKTEKIDIEKTNAIRFLYDDGCWYTLRPSGTEPKIKLYIYTKAKTMQESKNLLKEIEKTVLDVLYTIE